MNAYEEKKQRRIERYKELAQMNKLKAAQLQNSDNIRAVIGMAGEPIKVGHHSERKHRRLIERADRDMGKSIESMKKSEYYEHRAEAAELNDAIYSDDPDAIEKLEEKLEQLQKAHQLMKDINKEYRKVKGDIDKMELPTEKIKKMIQEGKANWRYSAPYRPFTSYALSRSNSNIRDTKKRLEKLRKQALDTTTEIEINGIQIIDNVEANRVQIYFGYKPDEELRKKLKSKGFRFSRANGNAWQRHRSQRALELAKEIVEEIE